MMAVKSGGGVSLLNMSTLRLLTFGSKLPSPLAPEVRRVEESFEERHGDAE